MALNQRRNFFKLVGLLCGGALLNKVWGVNPWPETPFYTSVLCVPKDQAARRIYQDPNDFWQAFHDPIAEELNRLFFARGQLLSINSQLTDSKRSCILTKSYRSEADYLEYRELWKQRSPGGLEKEVQLIRYRPITRLAT